MIEYPSFLPCPTWQYGQGMTAFAGRTPMESGWVRQRRRSPDTYVTLDLSFKMTVSTYATWQKWVNKNGYSWFRIPLDKFFGEQKLMDIRFTTPVQFAYDDWGNLVTTVSAEVYNGKVNPDPIPPWKGDTPIECRPYNCSSYEDWLIEIGQLEEYVGGLSATVIGDATPVPYPFSEVTYPGDGKWLFLNNYIAAPGVVTGYSAGGPNTNLMAIDAFTTDIDGPTLCSGKLGAMGAVNASNAAGVCAAVNPRVYSVGDAWGDWGMEAAIMELDIERGENYAMGGSLMRNTGKPWVVKWRSTSTQGIQDAGYVGIGVSTPDPIAGDITIGLSINNNNNNMPDFSNSFTVPGAAKRLNMFSGYIKSGAPYQAPVDGKYCVIRDIELVAQYAGGSARLTGQQLHLSSNETTPQFFELVGPWIVGFPTKLYIYGTAFYNFSGNFASFMGGLASADHTTDAYWRWEQNFESYTPPDYCG
jgi:hypothetical protein